MPPKSTVFWVSNTGPRDTQEARTLQLLRDSSVRLFSLSADQVDQLQAKAGDLIIFNTTPAGMRSLVRLLPSKEHVARVIRCEPDGICRQEMAELGLSQILDPKEGPELIRSRIISLLATSNQPALHGTVPAWRRTLIGESTQMRRVGEVIRLVGPRRCTVLITGETGTGKEVVARAVHLAGPRETGPFVAINCSALPAALLEAELFGHTRGAFTGATQNRVGRFEQANGGTLFLDEIGDLPMELQAKLLRVLQERELQRLGSSETIRVDARVIAATNCDLAARVREGCFREDLFYRLNVVPLQLPPLRTRIADVRPLGQHFLEKICTEEKLELKRLTPDAWAALESFEWPGNVRQLENAISSAVILSEGRTYLDVEDFPLHAEGRNSSYAEVSPLALPDHGLDFEKTVNAIERTLLTQALRRTGGNKKAAAEMLGLKRTTLSAKVRVLDIREGAA